MPTLAVFPELLAVIGHDDHQCISRIEARVDMGDERTEGPIECANLAVVLDRPGIIKGMIARQRPPIVPAARIARLVRVDELYVEKQRPIARRGVDFLDGPLR